MTVKMVREKIDTITYELEGPIEKAIEYLQEKEKYYKKNGYVNVLLDVDYDDERNNLTLCVEREETLREMTARIEAADRAVKQREENERKEYDRLHAKFSTKKVKS